MMDKVATDRAINRWFLTSLFGPASALSLLAFGIGFSHPDMAHEVQEIVKLLGLHDFISLRISGTNFQPAAYLYWIAVWLLMPLNIAWMYWVGVNQATALAMRTALLRGLKSRALDPKKYTLRWGYLRFSGGALLFGSLFVVQLLSAHEPSSCKGCESGSLFGFFLINWLGTQVLLMGTYAMCCYLVFWRSIQIGLQEAKGW